MGKILIVLVFIGVAYWYWSELGQNPAEMSTVDDPKKNARIIEECVATGDFKQEDIYKGSGESPEEICADQNNLYKTYTGWHRR